MGHAARVNPRSFEGRTPLSTVKLARWHMFAESFPTRDELDRYLTEARLTDADRETVEECLPARLRKPA